MNTPHLGFSLPSLKSVAWSSLSGTKSCKRNFQKSDRLFRGFGTRKDWQITENQNPVWCISLCFLLHNVVGLQRCCVVVFLETSQFNFIAILIFSFINMFLLFLNIRRGRRRRRSHFIGWRGGKGFTWFLAFNFLMHSCKLT